LTGLLTSIHLNDLDTTRKNSVLLFRFHSVPKARLQL
jgi:hypothetical protein